MNFDALEDLLKARKPKGLENWRKFEQISEKLEGKHAKDIMFTTSYPGQEGAKKYLGSQTGNLHFLLGYANPGFHMSKDLWFLVDPNLSEEEAAKKKHPSNPRYWKESGLEIEPEGDLASGKPHPSAKSSKKFSAKAAGSKDTTKVVELFAFRYTADPDQGVVFSQQNGHGYPWDLVKHSFLTADNPDLFDMMEDEEDTFNAARSVALTLTKAIAPFDRGVYPLAKAVLPPPGTVIVEKGYHFVVTPNSVDVFDSEGAPAYLDAFDREYHSFDLTVDGDTHPSILVNVMKSVFGAELDGIEEIVTPDAPLFVKGEPSPGWEDVDYDKPIMKRLNPVEGGYEVIPEGIDL